MRPGLLRRSLTISPRLEGTLSAALNTSATPWLMLLKIKKSKILSPQCRCWEEFHNVTSVRITECWSRKKVHEGEKRIHIEPLLYTQSKKKVCVLYKGNIFLHWQGVNSLKRWLWFISRVLADAPRKIENMAVHLQKTILGDTISSEGYLSCVQPPRHIPGKYSHVLMVERILKLWWIIFWSKVKERSLTKGPEEPWKETEMLS